MKRPGHIKAWPAALALAALAFAAGGALAQGPEEPPPPPEEREQAPAREPGVVLRLENADIRELIRWGAQHIEKNIILHPEVRGNVTVLAGAPVSAEAAYAVFVSILEVHGFAAVETTEAVKVLPAGPATGRYARLAEGGGAGSDALEARVLELLHIPPSQAGDLLRPMLGPSALLRPVPGANLILLADRRDRLQRAVDIVRRVDRPNPYEVRVAPLRHAEAEALAGQVTALLPRLFEGDAAMGRLALLADRRTNSLLMSGPPLHVEQTHRLVERLDQPAGEESAARVLPVQFLPAGELAEPLQRYAQVLQRGRGAAADEVSIVRSDSLNALIITAPEAVHRQLAGLVEQLDQPRAQVLVEAAIVEVNAQKALDYGVDWRRFIDGDQILVGGRLPGQLAIPELPEVGGGFTFGYTREDFWSVIRALAGDSDSNLLSTPMIVSMDNREAEILVGENVPFVTGSSTSAASPVSNPFQTIQRQDIGISLRIKPRINNDRSVTLEISQAVEQIAPTAAADAADIVTSKREINATVMVEDGEILVLGGLIRDDVTEVVTKVPLLGSLPLLGYAFRSASIEKTKRNLMVFIHPRILRRPADADAATGRYLERAGALRGGTVGRSPASVRETRSILFPSLEDAPPAGKPGPGAAPPPPTGAASQDGQDGDGNGAAPAPDSAPAGDDRREL